MLVITRYASQGFTVITPEGEEIYVRVLSIDPGKCNASIGVSAPKRFDIQRDNCINKNRSLKRNREI